MKLLYLHDGNVFVGTMAYNMGFDVISFNIFDFDFEMYPANHFDILWVNLSCEKSEVLRIDHLQYVFQDVLNYYKLKHWVVEYPDRRVQDDIVVWGVPFTDINYMTCGRLKKIRIYNNVFKWRPEEDTIYILHKTVIKEILENII